jgi:ribosomal protein S18 acetylase RimI-like enzyme
MSTEEPTDSLLSVIDRYCDAVPRGGARVEDFGAFTLFVREDMASWPYYARPSIGWTGATTVAAVRAVLDRQRALDEPRSIEWIAECAPAVRAPVEEAGLVVSEHPLMVLAANAVLDAPALPDGVQVRMIGADEPLLGVALMVPNLAFAELGTQVGDGGPEALAAAYVKDPNEARTERMRGRIRDGRARVAAAFAGDVPLCCGVHNPVGDTAEIVGMGTLPSARRQGLAHAVTTMLAADARAMGVGTVWLSAQDESVARVYGRVGFARIGTSLIAEEPSDASAL